MRGFFAALQFLTVCPVPDRFRAGKEELEASLSFFLPVGLLIGGLLALLDAVLRPLFPASLSSAILVVALALISGGMHCDGLSDTADGFFSSRPRERILEIMKDSRTGPMGVMAIVSVMVLKIAALAAVPVPARWWTLLITPLAAYGAVILNVALLPYARPEGGLGGLFRKRRSRPLAAATLFIVLALGRLAGGTPGLAAAGGTLGAGLLFAAYSSRVIGGYTGDTLGAVHELAGIVPALVVAGWGGAGGVL